LLFFLNALAAKRQQTLKVFLFSVALQLPNAAEWILLS
jgi:hypothetical protein